MPDLEITKYGYDFKRMITENELYKSEDYFPKGVTFTDPQGPENYQDDPKYNIEPANDTKEAKLRVFELVKDMHKKVRFESKNHLAG